jgi:hypothetical protein
MQRVGTDTAERERASVGRGSNAGGNRERERMERAASVSGCRTLMSSSMELIHREGERRESGGREEGESGAP